MLVFPIEVFARQHRSPHFHPGFGKSPRWTPCSEHQCDPNRKAGMDYAQCATKRRRDSREL